MLTQDVLKKKILYIALNRSDLPDADDVTLDLY